MNGRIVNIKRAVLCGACDEPIKGEAVMYQQHDRNNFARYTFTHAHSECASVFDDFSHINVGTVSMRGLEDAVRVS